MIGRLSYVAAVVDEPSRVADLLERAFDTPRENWQRRNGDSAIALRLGSAALLLIQPGHEQAHGQRLGIDHIAIEATSFEDASRLAVENKLTESVQAVRGICDELRFDLSLLATGGVPIRITEPNSARNAQTHAVSIDHIGVASADNRAAVKTFCGDLGFPLESSQTDMETAISVETFASDKYGVVCHTRETSLLGGLRVAFVTIGDGDIEFLEDIGAGKMEPSRGPGTTRQDTSVIGRFVQRRGPGLHHIALRVRDSNAALSRLAAAGIPLIDRVGRPGSRRAKIGFVNPPGLGGMLLHVVERP